MASLNEKKLFVEYIKSVINDILEKNKEVHVKEREAQMAIVEEERKKAEFVKNLPPPNLPKVSRSGDSPVPERAKVRQSVAVMSPSSQPYFETRKNTRQSMPMPGQRQLKQSNQPTVPSFTPKQTRRAPAADQSNTSVVADKSTTASAAKPDTSPAGMLSAF